MIRPKVEVEKDLADILPLLGPALFRGLQECGTHQAEVAHIYRKTTKRSTARDHITHELRMVLDGKSGVFIEDHDETTDFWFHSKYRMRSHKADEDFQIALGKSLQSSLFDENDQQQLSDQFEPTCLYCIYVPQKADPTAVEFYLTCPGVGGWVHQLNIGGGEVVGHITPRPIDDGDDFQITIPTEERRADKDGDDD